MNIEQISDNQKQTILALAECNLRKADVARARGYSYGAIENHIRNVRGLTGLDPMNFYDLHELVRLLKEGEGDG